ncbi:MAG: hypothetical protein OEY24_02820 [Candidatus Bathyarchaeota archaeon]|nr:hypothetical protein [Candidatus Bathyarchaeota archaeon]MDH5494622.1 hypothetical protein [Candidatus Bathyarchaeota archaeon]
MSQDTSPPQEMLQLPAEEEPKKNTQAQASLQELIDSLKSLQDDIGQICELTSEEKGLVTAFFESLLKLMQPLATTMPVSPATLPKEMGNVIQANIDPTGHLIILYRDGRAELKNLSEEKNRDLMIRVIKDVMPKFKQLTSAHRQKIEDRIKFLSTVTKELQKISKALSTAAT